MGNVLRQRDFMDEDDEDEDEDDKSQQTPPPVPPLPSKFANNSDAKLEWLALFFFCISFADVVHWIFE